MCAKSVQIDNFKYQVMSVSTRIYFDDRRKKKNKKYPLKLRVHHDGNTRLYPLGIDLNRTEEKDYKSTSPTKEGVKTLNEVNEALKKARAIIVTLDPFTFEEFEALSGYGKGNKDKATLPESGNENEVFYRYRKHIRKMKDNGQSSSVENYESAYKSLVKYLSVKRRTKSDVLPMLYFSEVDVKFLDGFEDWFMNRGSALNLTDEKRNYRTLKDGTKLEYSITTYSIYVTTLRTLMGMARDEGKISQVEYPFGKNKYSIPKRKNNPRALDADDVKKMMKFSFKDPRKDKYLDVWKLVFVSGGMNVTDVCRLKFKNLSNDGRIIKYYRQKTLQHKDQPEIKVFLPPRGVEILNKYKSHLTGPNQRVFPFIDPATPADKLTSRIDQFNKMVNKYAKLAAKKMEIEENVTGYVARHSAANHLLRNEKRVEIIRDILGHKNIETTQVYLGKFKDDQLKDASGALDI